MWGVETRENIPHVLRFPPVLFYASLVVSRTFKPSHLMKKLAAICLLSAALLHARADVTVVEHFHAEAPGAAGAGAPPDKDVTLQIKGDKVRIDDPDGKFSVILDTGTGDIIGIINDSKNYVKVPGDLIKGFVAQAVLQHPAVQNGDAPKITDAAKQEKVGDYNAEVYTMDTPVAKATFWLSKDIPESASLQAVLARFFTMLGKFGVPRLPDVSKLEGAAVKVQVVALDQKQVTLTITSVKQDAIADSVMQAPADYTEVNLNQMMGNMMSVLPGGPGGPGGQPFAPPQPPQP